MGEEAAGGVPLLRRPLPLCGLALAVILALAVAAQHFLSGGERRMLNLDRPSPLPQDFSLAAQSALTERRSLEPGLDFVMAEEGLSAFRFLDAGPSSFLEVSAGEIEVRSLDSESWPPRYADLRVHDLDARIDADDLPPWLDRLVGDGLLIYRLDPEAGRLEVSAFAIAAEGLGDVDLAFSLTGVREADLAAILAQGRLERLSMRLDDEGVLAHLVADLAREERVSEAMLRAQVSTLATAFAGAGNPPFVREFFAAVKTVMEHPDPGLVITMTADPPEPVPLAELAALRLWPLPNLAPLRSLNLHVDAR